MDAGSGPGLSKVFTEEYLGCDKLCMPDATAGNGCEFSARVGGGSVQGQSDIKNVSSISECQAMTASADPPTKELQKGAESPGSNLQQRTLVQAS